MSAAHVAQFHREMGKLVAMQSKKHLAPTSFQPPKSSTLYTQFFQKVYPFVFRYLDAPRQRWKMAALANYLRTHGLMFDDVYHDREPVIERANLLMPKDLLEARYRRRIRSIHLSFLRVPMPVEEQNYDPFVPYLAPYVEEAKFQLQEEEELLGFHSYDRRLFVGGVTGFGETETQQHFLTL